MARKANKVERAHMQRVAEIGCVVPNCGAPFPPTLHHTGTYMGGGRDHMKVVPLCFDHHLGREGIDGKAMSKRQWEAKYGTEEHFLNKVALILSGHQD